MLSSLLTILWVLSANPTEACIERCGAGTTRCMDRCASDEGCLEKCNRRQTPCIDACTAADGKAKQAARAKKEQRPCGGDLETRKIVPCTADEEQQQQREVLKNAKGLCKDEQGDYAACEGDQERTEQMLKRFAPRCTSADGLPIECPKKK